ncbi:MAG: S-layer homology domain-containing protein [Candidatus Peregrinibacteria bacterium]
MKKLIVGLLVFFVASQGAFAGVARGPSFGDVDEYNSYRNSIDWMARNGVVEGYGDGTFGIDNCVNRVEFLKMLFEIQGVDVTQYRDQALFPDTPSDAWYADYVRAGRARGAVNGYPDGTFKPANCVNRVEAMKMAILEFNGGQVPDYRSEYFTIYDDVSTDDWYSDYADYAFSANVVGTDHVWNSGDFGYHPDGGMTRGEVAEMLYRLRSLQDYTVESYQGGFKPAAPDEDLFFVGCDAKTEGLKNVNPESVLPADSDFVFDMDYSNANQNKALDAIIKKFSGSDDSLVDILKNAYNGSVHKQMSFDTAVEGVIDSKWEVAFGAYMADDILPDTIYVAANIDASEEAKYLIGRQFHDDFDGDIVCSTEGRYEYWTSEANSFYMVHSGEFFAMSNTADGLDSMVSKSVKGGGFKNSRDGDFVSMYMGGGLFSGGAMETYFGNAYDSYKNITFGVSVSNLAFEFNTEYNLEAGSKVLADYGGNALSLVNKAAGNNVLAYAEAPILSDLSVDSEVGYFGEIFEELASTMGLTYGELLSVLDSPFAFAVTNENMLLPGVAFYLDFDSGDSGSINKIVTYMDGEFLDMTADINEMWINEGNADSNVLFVENFGGTGLRRIYIEDNFTNSFWADGENEFGALARTIVDHELYYGVTSDNVFVVALYPDFENDYGRVKVSSDSGLKEARAALDFEGSSLGYVSFEEFVDMAEMYTSNFRGGSDVAEFGSFADTLSPLKYVVSSSEVVGNILKGTGLLKVQ